MTTATILFVTEALTAWLVAAYVPAPFEEGLSPRFGLLARAGLLVLVVAAIGWTSKVIMLAIALGITLLVLLAARPLATRSCRLHQWEMGVNVTVGLGILAAGLLGGRVGFPFLRVPLSEATLATCYAFVCSAILGTKASGYVVRGVLDRAGITSSAVGQAVDVEQTLNAAPTVFAEGDVLVLVDPDEEDIDVVGPAFEAGGVPDGVEYGRGRIIGYLERLLVIVLVARGRFEALGFLVAAKGLIRAKDLESREFAEYFLIGTLVSVALAVAIGLGLEQVLRALR